MQKTLRVKLIPLTKTDLRLLCRLKEEYTALLKDALKLIVDNDIRTIKQAHETCYEVLRRKYHNIHNKFVQEAYKRALAMYKSYLKLKKRYEKGLLRSEPSLPKVNENDVIDLHIDTFKLVQVNGTHLLKISKGNGEYVRFVVLEYAYFKQHLNWKIQNSKIVIENGDVYLHLTVSKPTTPKTHENLLVIDVNEDTVDCLLVTNKTAVFFRIRHDIRKIRMNYRRIRKNIQEKVKDEKKKKELLAKYGKRERERVEDRIKKISSLLAGISQEFEANLVVEDLKYLKNTKKKSKQLNHRLQTLPYRKLLSSLEYKAIEKNVNVVKVNPKGSSITCPICGYKSNKNRLNVTSFKCVKCGFEFDAQFVACLNLLSRADDSRLAIRDGRVIINRKAGLVVPADVAPDEVLIDEALREKSVPKVIQILKPPKVS